MVDLIDDTAKFDVAVDEYLRRSYDTDRRRALLRSPDWDRQFAAELAKLGWFALAVADESGGIGAPLSALGPVFTVFGRHLVVGALIETMLLPALLLPCADAGAVAAFTAAMESGTPLALVDAGMTDDWTRDIGSAALTGRRLSGAVNGVRFGADAGLLVVIADTDAGSVVCLADPSDPGVTIEKADSADPVCTYARVVFDAVSVSSSVAEGPSLVNRIRSWARLLIACELSGIAQRCLDRTIEYTRQREQFGRPIGSFQAVKHIAADMYARSVGLHNLCTAATADAMSADDDTLYVVAAAAKAYAADTAVRVCEDAIQLHGGIGFTTENELHWYYKHALALRGWYGDHTELQLRVGAALLGTRGHGGATSGS